MKFRVMNHSGDTETNYSEFETAEAMARFQALLKDGNIAATRKDGETDYRVTRDFKDLQDETVFKPQLKGG